MVETNLTQTDAPTAMEKHRVNKKFSDFPADGALVVMPFQSADRFEQFLLDRSHGCIGLRKVKYRTGSGRSPCLRGLISAVRRIATRMARRFQYHDSAIHG